MQNCMVDMTGANGFDAIKCMPREVCVDITEAPIGDFFRECDISIRLGLNRVQARRRSSPTLCPRRMWVALRAVML